MTRFEDASHFLRLIVLLAAGIVIFVAFRAYAIPAGFGQYGHYRGPALKEIRTQTAGFAGHETCETCHSEQHDKLAKGLHSGVHCEACHGPQATHAADIEPKPVLPKTPGLCVQCHEANGSKFKNFKTVASKDHSGGLDCRSCHVPHNPKEGL